MATGRILVVCTGNVCRSPLVERLLQQGLDQRWGPGHFEVASAGTGALVDHPMDERAAAVLRGLGGSSDGFSARRLAAPMVETADLVLTATRDHRAAVVRTTPRAMKRVFTVRELAAIVEGLPDEDLPSSADPAARLRELADVATRHRGRRRPGRPEDHDVVDPYRRADEVYVTMQEQVTAAVPHLFRALAPRRG
ncbi:low molecular weight phosphatase family protein [Ornithinimicrobium sp. W1665]|uniref:arsenate reductase/protein-tyrosine-phosphatase family protein n=1 Tax=Ornithinimicrobium sp. W1665 TaxID=3416666 RepID=UPI003CF6D01C